MVLRAAARRLPVVAQAGDGAVLVEGTLQTGGRVRHWRTFGQLRYQLHVLPGERLCHIGDTDVGFHPA